MKLELSKPRTINEGWKHRLYNVALTNDAGNVYRFDFKQGIGHKKNPSLEDILYCVALDHDMITEDVYEGGKIPGDTLEVMNDLGEYMKAELDMSPSVKELKNIVESFYSSSRFMDTLNNYERLQIQEAREM